MCNKINNSSPSKEIINIPFIRLKMIRDRTLPYNGQGMDNPETVYEFVKDWMADSDREIFLVLCLDNKNKLTHLQECSIGGTDFTFLVPKDILKVAILSNAQSIIVVHNHPSGDCTPSQEDKFVTDLLVKTCQLMGLRLLDHLIIGDDDYFSLIN